MGTIRVANETPNTPPTGTTEIFVDPSTKSLKTKDDAGLVKDYEASNGITSLTGEVLASGTGAVPATLLNSAVISKLLTGFVEGTGTISGTDSILSAIQKLAARRNSAWFAEASDGVVTLTSDFTMPRDMYYDTLTIDPAVTLFMNGFRLFAKNAIINNGIIDRSGNNAIGTAAGAALVIGTLGLSGGGSAGGTNAGVAGLASATSLGGNGGSGGLGSSGAGGAAGIAAQITAAAGGTELFQSALMAQRGQTTTNLTVNGGAGGGSGGGDGAAAGGGSGSGGGVININTRSLTGTGVIRAKGGNGGQPAGGNRGGGGGGGGGCISTVTENDVTMTSLTFDVSGGTGNSGSGTGVSGNNGSAGRIFRVRV